MQIASAIVAPILERYQCLSPKPSVTSFFSKLQKSGRLNQSQTVTLNSLTMAKQESCCMDNPATARQRWTLFFHRCVSPGIPVVAAIKLYKSMFFFFKQKTAY